MVLKKEGIRRIVVITAAVVITSTSIGAHFFGDAHNVHYLDSATAVAEASVKGDSHYRHFKSLVLRVFCRSATGHWIIRGSTKEESNFLYILEQGSIAEANRPLGSLDRIREYEAWRKVYDQASQGDNLQDSTDFLVNRSNRCVMSETKTEVAGDSEKRGKKYRLG